MTFVLLGALLGLPFVASQQPAMADLAIPDNPAGIQLAWALDQVDTGAFGTTEQTIAEHFSDGYLAVVTPAQLIGYFRDYLFPYAPMTVVRYEGGATELRANAILQGPFGYWRVELGVTPNEPHKIDALWFEPVYTTTTPLAPARSWSEVKRDLSRLAPHVSVTIAELGDGVCDPIARVDPELILPVASSFKLYVLGELAHQVENGQASWNELIPIDPGYISQPNGEMRNAPVGAEFTLAHFAEQMISQSDNTATDHLIGRLGREDVQAAFALMGQADPTVNVPLMLTREWFALRMRFTDEQLAEFLAMNDAERLAFLEEVAGPVAGTILETEPWPGSAWASEIEWFASSGDLCRALAYLQHQGTRAEMQSVLNALSLNPEIVFDPGIWSFVGYKGGYETGVMSENFLLQRASDGRWFSISAVIYDPIWEINAIGLRQLILEAVEMLAFEE
ncbi:MAG: serine hydrolase [Thermomicrobiales bacterium]|nr:serine hydrolase [Thermomicrobiales bacterium]